MVSTSRLTLSMVFWGAAGVAWLTCFLPISATTPAITKSTTVTIRAASHGARKVASARMIVAISAPTPYSATTPAPPNRPAPTPACLAFSVISAWASRSSFRMRSVDCWVSRVTSSEVVGSALEPAEPKSAAVEPPLSTIQASGGRGVSGRSGLERRGRRRADDDGAVLGRGVDRVTARAARLAARPATRVSDPAAAGAAVGAGALLAAAVRDARDLVLEHRRLVLGQVGGLRGLLLDTRVVHQLVRLRLDLLVPLAAVPGAEDVPGGQPDQQRCLASHVRLRSWSRSGSLGRGTRWRAPVRALPKSKGLTP